MNCLRQTFLLTVLFTVTFFPFDVFSQCGTIFTPCRVCSVTATISSITGGTIVNDFAEIDGNVGAGDQGIADDPLVISVTDCGTISMTVDLAFHWDQGSSVNWIHGISFFDSGNWLAAEGTIDPSDPGWIFLSGITGVCSNTSYGAGFYWDPVGTDCSDVSNTTNYNGSDCEPAPPFSGGFGPFCEGDDAWLVDGDPSDNWGIDCTTDCPQFGFELEYCPNGSGTLNEEISFFLTEDGETGGWINSDGCIFELVFPIIFESAGVQLPEFDETICLGECFTLDAGDGCSDYEWSTGETTQIIEVCPTETTVYEVSVSAGAGCTFSGETTIIVDFCCEADAGEITANTPVCPGETINYTVTDFNATVSYTQTVFIADDSGTIIEILPDNTGSYSSPVCGNFTIYSYNYLTIGGAPVPTVGLNVSAIDCEIECCELIPFEISFDDTEAPTFLNAPMNISFDCFTDVPPMEDLDWEDNCAGTGTVAGVETGSIDFCSGGTITRTWEITDACDNTTTHEQTITVDPPLEAAFVNPPSDETVDCGTLPSTFPNLPYTNNMTGDCLIEGEAIPTVTENFDPICGGTVMASYTFTDVCGRTINHDVTITIEPAPEPVFSDMPADMTLDCSMQDVTPDAIMASNGDPTCLIEQLVMPQVTDNADECNGGEITILWEFMDPCGRTISHTQVITIEPSEEPEFIDPPGDINLVCGDAIPTFDDLMYTNGQPGSCLIEGSVSADVDANNDICGGMITAVWEFMDDCGRTISHTQVVTIDPAEEAEFVDPPGDLNLTCDESIPSFDDLMYTNGQTGSCEIEGTVPAVVDADNNVCGGMITAVWEFTDDCGRMISHTQVVTIDPADEAAFIDPPGDLNLECGDAIPSFDDLMYSNGQSGVCEIEGAAPAVVDADNDVCGGMITAVWEFTDDCGRMISHTQVVTIEPSEEPVFINPPADLDLVCGDPDPTFDELMYSNGQTGDCMIEGTVEATIDSDISACGGSIIAVWEFTDDCGRSIEHTQLVTLEPAPEAEFINLPPDINISCSDFENFVPDDLEYTNASSGLCLIEGFMTGEVDGTVGICGGNVDVDYEFTDDCGRTITYSQTITVEPAEEAVFVDLPDDITLDCDAINNPLPNIDYSNNGFGDCLIEGNVSAFQSGVVDACGGDINYVFTFTDMCGRTINYIQNVTILPAPEPEFIDPPIDQFLDCDEELPDDLSLEYDNFANDPCNISGSIDPDIDQNGNETTLTWTFVNSCTGEEISHQQVISESISVQWDEDEFDFALCVGAEFDLASIDLFDENNTDPTITYHDDFPPDASNELSSTIVNPDFTTTYYILGNNEFDCPDVAEVLLELELQASAGSDNSGEICIGEGVMNLFDYLADDADLEGNFFQLLGPELNFSDATSINISTADPGLYLFEYFIDGTVECDPDAALIEVDLFPLVELELLTIACSTDFQSYIVEVVNDGYDVTASAGNITVDDGVFVIIENIPIGQDLVLDAVDSDTGCEGQFVFTPPNCDCPTVPEPMNVGDQLICVGDANPTLSVTVDAGTVANWYDAPVGGTELIASSNEYTPTATAPGVYTFYVEAQSMADPACTSATRIPVILEILSAPVYNPFVIQVCDEDQDGILSWDEATLQSFININPADNAEFYATMADAQAETNALALPYVNVNPFSETLFVVVSNAASCSSIVQLTMTIFSKPELMVDITNESCDGANNGSFTIVGFDPGSTYTLENDLITTATISNLSPGNYDLEIVDGNACSDEISFQIDGGIELSLESFAWDCSDNGTNTDATDDFYEISFQVNTETNIGTYNVLDASNNLLGTFDYAVVSQLMLPADGSSQVFTFTDVISGCPLTQMFGPLSPCSSDCIISVDQLDFVCNDNDTDAISGDDFYDITINVSAVNGGGLGTYTIAVDGVVSFNFEYGVQSIFSLPANGALVTLTIADSEITGCSINEPIGPLDPCSQECILQVTASDPVCEDNGTPNDSTDDIFFFDFEVTGMNSSGEFVIPSISFSGMEGVTYTLGPFNISDPFNALFIEDINNSACDVELDVEPPLPCSEACLLNVEVSNILCDNNGTTQDDSDDVFTFDLVVSGINTSSGFNISELGFDGEYDEVYTFGPFNINDPLPTLVAQDADIADCFTDFEVDIPTSCSDECTLSAVVSNVLCDDNGTTQDDSDDVFFFDLVVTGVNSSSGFNIAELGFDGQYGELNTFGPFDVSDPFPALIAQDMDNDNCTIDIEVDVPDSCSDECTMTSVVSNILCDNNGTSQDDTDDVFFFNVVVSGVNTSGGYNISELAFDGEYDEEYTFGPFNVNDPLPDLIAIDFDDPSCIAELDVVAPTSCSDECIINAVISNVFCDDNGTTQDDSDDVFFFDLVVTGVNNSLGFSISELAFDGVYGEVNTFGPFLINESFPTLIIQDSEEPACEFVVDVDIPTSCSNECVLDAEITNIVCDDNGTTQDETDDVFFFEIEVGSVNASSGFNIPAISFTGNYNEVYALGPFDIEGAFSSLLIQDIDDPDCLLELDVQAPESCSETCTLIIAVDNITCQDNGTSGDNSDDVFFFDIVIITAVNASAGYTIESLGFNGAYNETNTLGPFNISDGTFVVLVQDQENEDCFIELTVDAPPVCSDCSQTLTLSEPTELSCGEPQTSITATASEDGVIVWSGPNGFTDDAETIMVSVPGIYEVSIVFPNGCGLTDEVEVFSNGEIPIALFAPVETLTCDIDDILLDGSASIYPSTAEFIWTDEDGNVLSTELTLMVENPGTYFFEIFDPLTGCSSEIQEIEVLMQVSDPSAVIFADPGNVLDCFVETINLSTEEEPFVLYNWIINNDETIEANEISVDQPLEISLIALDTITGCFNESNISILDLTEFPVIIVEETGAFECEGESEVCFDVSSSPFSESLDFAWFNENGVEVGDNSSIFCTSTPGIYMVELTDPDSGCVNADTLFVDDIPIVPGVSLPPITTVEVNGQVELTVDIDIPMTEVAAINWTPVDNVSCQDCVTTIIENPIDGLEITVEVISISGCVSTATTILRELTFADIYIPTVFSTESQLGNDFFTLFANDQVELIEEMFIFDRWGELVFSTEGIPPNEPTLGWDGRFNGDFAVQGVYVYLFKVRLLGGEEEIHTGSITLLR